MDSGDAAIIGSTITGISGVLIAIINRPKAARDNIPVSAPPGHEYAGDTGVTYRLPSKKNRRYLYVLPATLIIVSISGFILSGNLKNTNSTSSYGNVTHADESSTSATVIQPQADYRDLCSRYISASDLQGKSPDELALIRNTIYAMHGYVFHKNPIMVQYFNSKSWYTPKQDFNADIDLSQMDKDNVKLIKSLE